MTTRTPEGKVKDKVVALLKKHQVWYCFPATFGRGRSGIPDIIACHCGWFIGIECKAPGGEPTPAQHVELTNIKRADGVACVIDGAADQMNALDSLLRTVAARGMPAREWEELTPRRDREHAALRVAVEVLLDRIRRMVVITCKLIDRLRVATQFESTLEIPADVLADINAAKALMAESDIITHASELLVASDPEAKA